MAGIVLQTKPAIANHASDVFPNGRTLTVGLPGFRRMCLSSSRRPFLSAWRSLIF